ncbi:MAG: MmcQ/YjbR family DNA-binding protein [Flavobacteriaceae bacterium]|nr:MmcQ/YjbR family DNA-binding protein [Flavobacteriaceae bacterium]
MNIEQLREYCISKKGVTEEFPFDFDTLVFKVMGKMFALAPLSRWEQGIETINLKCDPEWAIELRDTYDSIDAGFHMSKKHWNTVTANQDTSDKFLFELIDHSYELVIKGLTKKLRIELQNFS